jgi:hypothetical protein
VSWEDRQVDVKMSRDAVKRSPEYDRSNPADAEPQTTSGTSRMP